MAPHSAVNTAPLSCVEALRRGVSTSLRQRYGVVNLRRKTCVHNSIYRTQARATIYSIPLRLRFARGLRTPRLLTPGDFGQLRVRSSRWRVLPLPTEIILSLAYDSTLRTLRTAHPAPHMPTHVEDRSTFHVPERRPSSRASRTVRSDWQRRR